MVFDSYLRYVWKLYQPIDTLSSMFIVISNICTVIQTENCSKLNIMSKR